MARTKRTAQAPGRPSPRLEATPVERRAGDPSPTHDACAGARVVGPRGTEQAPASREATGKGNRSRGGWGQGVGGLHTSEDVGEQENPWTRPSQGGPCWCDPLGGPMSNALTLRDRSPGLQEVVGREVATSHINGRAGWWKSPCPDLARGRGGQPPGLLYKTLLRRQAPRGAYA